MPAQDKPAYRQSVTEVLAALSTDAVQGSGRGGVLRRRHMPLKAVDGVSFELAGGQTLGIVGGSAAASPRWAGLCFS